MRRPLIAVTLLLACWMGLPSPVAAQQASGSIADLVLAGAPLVASTGMPSETSAATAAAAPDPPPDTAPPPSLDAATPVGVEANTSPAIDIPNPLDLLGGLDPRSWAGAILDTVVQTLAGALLEAIRGFVDWALGVEDSSLNFLTRTPGAGTYDSSTVHSLWDLSRAIANAGLAIIVMWGGFNIVVKEHMRTPYDGVMELLPRVILAALGLNLTLEIARVLIDLNNAFAGAIGDVGLPGYDHATASQSGMAMILVAVAYGIVALLLAFQMLARLALIDVLIVLAPVMVLTWVLPQTQSWARWWAHLLPITVFQQCIQVMTLRLGSALMVELTPGSVSNALLTLLLGIAVCYLTLRVPTILSSQARFSGLSSVVSLVVLSRAAGGFASRGAGTAAGAGRR